MTYFNGTTARELSFAGYWKQPDIFIPGVLLTERRRAGFASLVNVATHTSSTKISSIFFDLILPLNTIGTYR